VTLLKIDDAALFSSITISCHSSFDASHFQISAAIDDTDDVNILTIGTGYIYDLNTWYHVELDFDIDSGTTRLFVDGSQVGSSSNTGTRAIVTDYLTALIFSSGFGVTNTFIDDVQIYEAEGDEDYNIDVTFDLDGKSGGDPHGILYSVYGDRIEVVEY